MRKILLSALLISLLTFCFGTQTFAKERISNARTLNGMLNNAPFTIVMPFNWNGTLLVFAHGYRDKADHTGEVDDRTPYPTLSPREFQQQPDMEAALLNAGYALIASAYRENGWAVREGIEDTLALTQLFKNTFGQPEHTIIYGVSMGSLVALQGAEKHGDVYDGVICGCGPVSGSTLTWDQALALANAYDVTFGWQSSWGTFSNVRNDLDFETEVLPVLLGQLQNPANLPKFEFIRLVNGLPSDGFYDGTQPGPFLILGFFFATEGRAELQRRAGGQFTQNLTHTYRLSDLEKGYLASIGLTNADALLSNMNGNSRKVDALTSARTYLQQNYDPSGKLQVPVLTIQTDKDGLVPANNESALFLFVNQARKTKLLSNAYTNSVSHCAFTQAQFMAAINAMVSWLETGTRPDENNFPTSLGFLPNFTPPAWFQPVPRRPPFFRKTEAGEESLVNFVR